PGLPGHVAVGPQRLVYRHCHRQRQCGPDCLALAFPGDAPPAARLVLRHRAIRGKKLPSAGQVSCFMTQLADLAHLYQRVAQSRGRGTKLELLAAQLRSLDHEEVEAGVHFLSGKIRQGRTGIGFATLNKLSIAPATAPELSLTELDQALESLTGLRGAGVGR